MVKQLLLATRVPGHVQPIGRPCGTWMHYAVRDVKDMGQQMGYRSLEWNWPKEAMNRPIGQEAKLPHFGIAMPHPPFN